MSILWKSPVPTLQTQAQCEACEMRSGLKNNKFFQLIADARYILRQRPFLGRSTYETSLYSAVKWQILKGMQIPNYFSLLNQSQRISKSKNKIYYIAAYEEAGRIIR